MFPVYLMAVTFVIGLFLMYGPDFVLRLREKKLYKSMGIPTTYRQWYRDHTGYWPTTSSCQEYQDALNRFDFQKHWAMCHNEVRLLTGKGGDPSLLYQPVVNWFDRMYLDAFTNKFNPTASGRREDLFSPARALLNARPWEYLDNLKS